MNLFSFFELCSSFQSQPPASFRNNGNFVITSLQGIPSLITLMSHPEEQQEFQLYQEGLESRSNRRRFLKSMKTKSAAVITATIMSSSSSNIPSAFAYDKAFPDTLDFSRTDAYDMKKFKKEKIQLENPTRNTQNLNVKDDLLPSVAWAAAAWLLTGSRSNPLVTPIANVLYDANDEENNQWLRDRNEGLFAPIPLGLSAVLLGVFASIGILLHQSILLLEGGLGDADISLQLAGVSLIGGASLELGRIASGEKKMTKEDSERAFLLETEFEEFASRRLKKGGNCHRSEVIRAFRRFNSKYRNAENPQNPEYDVSDLEIERLIKSWSRRMGNQEMSSAGFFNGIQIDDQSDVLLLS